MEPPGQASSALGSQRALPPQSLGPEPGLSASPTLSCSGARPRPGPPGAPLEGVPLRPDPDPGRGGGHGCRVPDLQAAQHPPSQQDPPRQHVRGGQGAGQQVPALRPSSGQACRCVRPSPQGHISQRTEGELPGSTPPETRDAWPEARHPGERPSASRGFKPLPCRPGCGT